MIRRVIIVVVILSAIIGWAWYSDQKTFGSDAFRATLHGKVVDTKGRPVVGIDVFYVRCYGKGVLARTITKRDGSFVFPSFDGTKLLHNDPGCFVAFEKGRYIGWKTGPAWSYVLPVSIANESFDIVVDKPVDRVLKVVDISGNPVAGASVSITRLNDDYELVWSHALQPYIHLAPSTTDASGEIQVAGFPADSDLRYNAVKPGFAFVSELSTQDKLVLARTGKITGKVSLKDGKPVSGAKILVGSDETVTGVNGLYQLDVLPGKYDVTVSGDWIKRKYLFSIVVHAGRETCHDFTVDHTAHPPVKRPKGSVTISGTVVDEVTRKPLPYIGFRTLTVVEGQPEDLIDDVNFFSNSFVQTDKSGKFKTSVTPGAINILSDTGNPYYSCVDSGKRKIIAKKDLSGITLYARRSRLVRGYVRDTRARPVAGAVVYGSGIRAVTDSRGEFLFADYLQAKRSGLLDWSRMSRSSQWDNQVLLVAMVPDGRLGGGQLFNNGLPGGVITLTVFPARSLIVDVRDTSGKPLSSKMVHCSPKRGGYPGLSAQVTNAKGEATLAPLYVGVDYDLGCRTDGFDELDLDLPRVGSRTWVPRKQVTLNQTDRTVTGVVYDKAGNPVAGAEIRLGYRDTAAAITDSRGRFRCGNVESGKVRITAVKGSLMSDANLYADESEVTITLGSD